MERTVSHSQPPRQIDYLERISRVIVLAAFAIALTSFILAPLLAIAWQRQPFPGFQVDQTLVVNANHGQGWGAEVTGIRYPERVVRVAGQRVATSQEFDRIIRSFQVGDRIQVFTISPDGSEHLYPDVKIIAFPRADMMRMFWLPYFVGWAYLAIGIWIYRLRGRTRPGRALAYFCIVTAIATALLFDVSTSHVLSLVWTISLAQIGGALISLAWRFPEEWFPVKYQPAILALPYLISLGLSARALLTLYDFTHPWAYVRTWEAGQRYAGLGSIIFIAVILYRAYAGRNTTVRRQARLMLVGSMAAFFPITLWFVAPLFDRPIAFNPIVFLPTLLFFPLSIGLAILRYQLWEIDNFISYAFVYGASTAILGGVFAALGGFTQLMFIATTGAKSDAAIVITTLIVATAFTPLKAKVQKFVDRNLSEAVDKTGELRAFGEQVRAFVAMNDVALLSQRLLAEAITALNAESGVLSVIMNDQLHPLHTRGKWKGNVALSVPLEFGGQRYGLLQLGPHRDDRPYSDAEGEAMQQVATQVAYAISLAWPRYIHGQDQGSRNLARPVIDTVDALSAKPPDPIKEEGLNSAELPESRETLDEKALQQR
jgi:hypothetical protein